MPDLPPGLTASPPGSVPQAVPPGLTTDPQQPQAPPPNGQLPPGLQAHKPGSLPPGLTFQKPGASTGRVAGGGIGSEWKGDLDADADKYGVPRSLAESVQRNEEGPGDPNAVSSAGAVGLMQTMPDLFRSYEGKTASLADPVAQLDAGAHYLGDLWKEYGGDVSLVAANYNGGPGAVAYYHKHGTLEGYGGDETLNYVANVKATQAAIEAANQHSQSVMDAHHEASAEANLGRKKPGTGRVNPNARPPANAFEAVAKAAAPLAIRSMQDLTASGFTGSIAGAVAGTSTVASESVRAMAKHSPQQAANLAEALHIDPQKLGLNLPKSQFSGPLSAITGYMDAITQIPRDATFNAAMFLGNVADAVWWVPLNANMRDAALNQAAKPETPVGPKLATGLASGDEPGGPNITDVQNRLITALQHPDQAGRVLDDLNHDYGFMRNADLNYWTSNPTIKKYLLSAKPTTPQGVLAQRMIAMHSNLAQFFLHAPYTTGVVTGVGEALNPVLAAATPERLLQTAGTIGKTAVNSVGRLKLTQTAFKAASKLHADTMANVTESAFKGNAPANATLSSIAQAKSLAKKASTFVREQMPITGEPYSATMGDAYGQEGIARMGNVAANINQTPWMGRNTLNNPNLLGNLGKPEQDLVHEQQDVFFNPQRTLYVKSPGGTAPTIDPATGKMSMRLGIIPDVTQQYDYAYSTFKPFGTEGTQTLHSSAGSSYEHAVLNSAFGPEPGKVAKIEGLLNKMNPQEAFAEAGVPDAYADFEKQMEAVFAKNPPKDQRAGAQIFRTAAGERIATELGKKAGWKRVIMQSPGSELSWNTAQVHFLDPEAMPEFNTPNKTEYAGTPLFTRAGNTTQAILEADKASLSLDPELRQKIIPGHPSRMGMWKDGPDSEKVAVQKSSGGAGGAPGESPSLFFPSLEEARGAKNADGSPLLTQDPDFVYGVALEAQLARGYRHQMATNFLRDQHTWTKKGGEIDYDVIYRDLNKQKLFGDTPAPATPFGAGPEGYDAFEDYVNLAAKNKTEKASLGSVLPDQEMKLRTEQEAAKIHGAAKTAYGKMKPGVAYDAAKRFDLNSVRGYGVPEDVMISFSQADPILQRMYTGKGAAQNTWDAVVPSPDEVLDANGQINKNWGGDFVEGFSNVMRLAMLADPTYHPLVNLSTQMFAKTGNVGDVLMAFFLPHLIKDEDYEIAERDLPAARKGVASPIGGKQATGEFAYARGQVDRSKNPWTTLLTAPQRAKMYATAMKNAGVPAHRWPQAAIHFLDDEQQNLVFSVWEDAYKALLYKRLRAKYSDPYRARNETIQALTGEGGLTSFEKKLGLNRLAWFWTWSTRMTRFWAEQLYKNPRNIYAPMAAVRTQNENTAPGSEDERPGVGLGGARENRVAFNFGGQTYLSPPLTTPNFVWGGPVAEAIADPLRSGIKFVDSMAMNRLSGGIRVLTEAAESGMQNPSDPPKPGQLIDQGDPNLGLNAHTAATLFSNVAGNFQPMEGPLTGPVMEAAGQAKYQVQQAVNKVSPQTPDAWSTPSPGRPTAGFQPVLEPKYRGEANYADQSVRSIMHDSNIPMDTRQHLFVLVQAYESNPTEDTAAALVQASGMISDYKKSKR
jgi:hypothetical protein